jgi:hypothetical protein
MVTIAPKMPKPTSRPASAFDASLLLWNTKSPTPVPDTIGRKAKSFARKSVIPE